MRRSVAMSPMRSEVVVAPAAAPLGARDAGTRSEPVTGAMVARSVGSCSAMRIYVLIMRSPQQSSRGLRRAYTEPAGSEDRPS